MGEGYEEIVGTFPTSMLKRFLDMGLDVGCLRFMLSPLAHLGVWRRQPDSCWGPPGRNEPFSLVLEIAMDGTDAGLYADARN